MNTMAETMEDLEVSGISSDKKERKHNNWQRMHMHPLFQVIVFVLYAFLEFVFLELFFGISYNVYSMELIMKNVVIIMACNLILVGVFHALRPALLLSVLFFLATGVANFFIISFRGYGIVFMDLYAVQTAMTVAGEYSYHIDGDFVLGTLGYIALGLGCFLFVGKRQHRYCDIRMVLLSLAGIALSLCFFFWTMLSNVFFRDVSTLTWDHNIGMKEYGYILYFSANAGKAVADKPVGYSVQKADEILSRYQEGSFEYSDDGTKKPNLILIMNESFSDISVLGACKTNREVMPFFYGLQENTIKGYAYSSVYGGYTSNSEFEFLTGCSKAFLPGNPYLQYLDGVIPSLITNLKSQGYSKAIAVHPYQPSGYNRNRVYPLLGFDEFITIDDFSKENLVRGYVGDEENYSKLIELFEQKETDEPLCIFNVTMQNHNPYDDTSYSFEEPIQLSGIHSESVNQYLSLMHMSDQALEKLIGYFKNVEEPTIILLFGDHQPHLNDSFYYHIMGKNPDSFSEEQVMKKHQVPFMIWANYDIPEQETLYSSLNYLSKLLLQTANLKLSSFDRFLLDLQKKMPSFCASGYYGEDGILYQKNNAASPYKKFVDEYEIVQYNYLFDDPNRLTKYFAIQ